MPDNRAKLYHASSSYYTMIARYAIELSGLTYESHLLDIHQKREQLRPWYVAINPAMTVPTLVIPEKTLCSSLEILDYALANCPDRWFEPHASDAQAQAIEQLLQAHDRFAVERLTFNAIMQKLPPVRILFPKLLRKTCKDLEALLQRDPVDADAIRAKLSLNQQRLAYFSEPLHKRQAAQLAMARDFIAGFPSGPQAQWLFGGLPSRADVVLLVFLARLNAIGLNNTDLVPSGLTAWFEHKAETVEFLQADVWLKFNIWRLLTHR